jgi:hypothetical protein
MPRDASFPTNATLTIVTANFAPTSPETSGAVAPQLPISDSSSTNALKRYVAGAAKLTKKAKEALRVEKTLLDPWEKSGFKKHNNYNRRNAVNILLKVDSWLQIQR